MLKGLVVMYNNLWRWVHTNLMLIGFAQQGITLKIIIIPQDGSHVFKLNSIDSKFESPKRKYGWKTKHLTNNLMKLCMQEEKGERRRRKKSDARNHEPSWMWARSPCVDHGFRWCYLKCYVSFSFCMQKLCVMAKYVPQNTSAKTISCVMTRLDHVLSTHLKH